MDSFKHLTQVLPALPAKGREMLYIAAHPAMLTLVLMFATIDVCAPNTLSGYIQLNTTEFLAWFIYYAHKRIYRRPRSHA
jgi:hypothetical protein